MVKIQISVHIFIYKIGHYGAIKNSLYVTLPYLLHEEQKIKLFTLKQQKLMPKAGRKQGDINNALVNISPFKFSVFFKINFP